IREEIAVAVIGCGEIVIAAVGFVKNRRVGTMIMWEPV
ncbi:hypothetical protein A2U01_0000621, partial [Trifolium medium]|nr:hypothetical protein [Trifolium medium]